MIRHASTLIKQSTLDLIEQLDHQSTTLIWCNTVTIGATVHLNQQPPRPFGCTLSLVCKVIVSSRYCKNFDWICYLAIHVFSCRSCPEGTFVATLKPDTCTVKMLAETWSYGSLESKTKYLKFIIENCGSIGVFLKDDPTHPVSWAMFSNFGHLMHVYTLSEHRGKGYAKTAVLGIMKEMLEIGMTPVLEIVKGNAASTKMFAGLGFVEAYSATWKKYL